MNTVTEEETRRQYRVARQTLSIHADLRDRYKLWSRSAEVVLMSASVLFCVVAFAPDPQLESLGISPDQSSTVVAVGAVAALIASFTLALVDWRGEAHVHSVAANEWARAVSEFRRRRDNDGSWSANERGDLDRLYHATDRRTGDIPSKLYTKYKARYLRKVKASKLQDQYPGCPHILIRVTLAVMDGWTFLRDVANDSAAE